MSAIIYQRFPNIFERYSNLSLVNISRRKAQTVFTYLFIYLTTILLQAVAWLVQPCRVTTSVENTTQEELKTKRKCKNQYTALLASNTALQERINSIEYSIWKGGRRIRHII